MCFTHYHVYLSSLTCFNREELKICQNTTVGQTSTSHHHVVTLIQSCTVLQEVAPCCTCTHIYIAFVVVQELECTSICKLRDREVWIVLRVWQRLDRLVSSHELTCLGFCWSCCFEIHISHTIIADKLNLTCHFVDAWRNTQATCHWHEEDVTAMSIGYASVPNTCRRNRRTTQIAVGIYLDVFRNPSSQLVPIFLESSLVSFRNCLFEECLVRSQHFVCYTRVAYETTEVIHVFLIYMRLHVVNQYFETHIAQVLSRDTLQHVDTTCLRLVRTETSQEIGNHTMVTTRSHENLGYCIFIQLILLSEFTSRFISHESSYVSIADRVFNFHATAVFSTLFRSYFRHIEAFSWRDDVEMHRISFACLLVQLHYHFIVLTKRYLSVTELTILWSPYQHVTLTSRQECLAFCIRLLVGYGIEFSIVVYLKFYLRISNRLVGCINHLNGSACKRSIVTNDIDFCEVSVLVHDFFRTIVTAENLGVHQHTTRSRCVEPSEVQYRFRFTSTQEVPLAIYPSFYPSVIVIGMCPTWSIHLTSWNTYRTESSYGESWFFTTTSVCSLYRSQRRAGTSIRRSINHLFMTPVVHFQYRIVQRKILNSILQFFIKHLTAIIQIFIVHTNRKYKVTEFAFRNQLTPWHFLLCLQCVINVFQKEFTCIVGDVTQRHVCIQESQCFTLLLSQLLSKHLEQVTLIPFSSTLVEIALNKSTFRLITDQVIGCTRECRKHQHHTHRTNG